MDTKYDIIIAGAGPAGALTGILLARQGYRVAVISAPRTRGRVEGFSQRTVDILDTHGFKNARAAVGPLVGRVASWAGEQGVRNQEYVTERSSFDEALVQDLIALHIDILDGSPFSVLQSENGVKVDVHGQNEPQSYATQFYVEARGRAAPQGSEKGISGPATTALVRRVEGTHQPPHTAVTGFPDGWAWYVADGSGPGYLQIFVDSRDGLPKRGDLADFFEARVADITETKEWFAGGAFRGPVMSHNTAPVLAKNPLKDRILRVGDAACALDPLSGNGVFAALGSALSAAPVIHTLLQQPENSELAKSFYLERTQLTFERFCRTGRDFYRMETRWPTRLFWQARQAWPDDEPSHPSPHAVPVRFERKPVVENGLITAREVCVTPDYPRGIWQVDEVPVARLLTLLKDYSGRSMSAVLPEISTRMYKSDRQVRTAINWLRHRKLLLPGDEIRF
ncbi:MAG: FAD-dependent monooxygenase [Fimbriimonadaceae bacterium]|nr:FAD-dependent monooxygenase [Alphaproteobacteria bacterium]